VYPFHGRGGMQRYVYTLGKFLNKKGIDVEIVTSSAGNKNICKVTYENLDFTLLNQKIGLEYKKNISIDNHYENDVSITYEYLLNIPIIRSIIFLFQYILFTIKVAVYLANNKFDILHSFKSNSLAYLLFFRKRKPVIVQPFANEEFKHKGIKNIIITMPDRVFLKYCVKKADRVSSQGKNNTKDILNLFNIERQKIVVIKNGVELDYINNVIQNPVISRSELGLNKDDLILITVNRLDRSKRVDLAVNTLKLLIDSGHNNIKLIIIGDGPEDGYIKKIMMDNKLDRSIHINKKINDELLYSYLHLSDIYINTAETEYFLLSVMEGMACRLPVISLLPQEDGVINGVNGFIVASDLKHIAEKVVEITRDGNLDSYKSASYKIINNYDWEIVTDEIIDVYQSLQHIGVPN
jgi:glycosyltransferase involved in cell wall biosynthesis